MLHAPAHCASGFCVKPVLNWANVSSRPKLEVFGEASWFLIGPTFLLEPVGSIRRSYIWVRKASLNMFWEHSPY